MKIVIEGTEKEIAALITELQGRRDKIFKPDVRLSANGNRNDITREHAKSFERLLQTVLRN